MTAGAACSRKGRLVRLIRRGSGLDRGNVAVEFALALPILLMMLLASAELGRFVILHQKIDRVAVTMADLVSRSDKISEDDLDDIFAAAGQVALPFGFTSRGSVTISSVTNLDGKGPKVAWQRSGGGTFTQSSRIGREGRNATLPADFILREGESAIISEAFYDFEPFLSEMIVRSQVLYRRAHHRPRLGTLETIDD